ncbi:MAG: Hsp20/alpha crystallin family protein [Cyanobacteria bacterium J06555_13]
MAIIRRRPFDDLKHWEPFGEIDVLRQEMNKLFEQFVPGGKEDGKAFPFAPSAELDETNTEIHLKLEVPGMTAEDLEIEVMDEAVFIKGERKSESKTEEEGLIRSEFHYGKFERLVPMPARVEKEEVSAEYKDGVLSLTLPKSPVEKKEAVKVKVAA